MDGLNLSCKSQTMTTACSFSILPNFLADMLNQLKNPINSIKTVSPCFDLQIINNKPCRNFFDEVAWVSLKIQVQNQGGNVLYLWPEKLPHLSSILVLPAVAFFHMPETKPKWGYHPDYRIRFHLSYFSFIFWLFNQVRSDQNKPYGKLRLSKFCKEYLRNITSRKLIWNIIKFKTSNGMNYNCIWKL